MEERTMQFRVGVVVLATLIIAGVLVLIFGEAPRLFEKGIIVHVRFPRAPGVMVDTPVRKSGILIGRVRSVELAEDGTVQVTLGIFRRYQGRIYRDEVCRIEGGSLLGDSVISFVPSGKAQGEREPIQDGDTIQGQVAPDAIQVVNQLQQGLQDVARSIVRTSEDIDRVAVQISRFLEQNNERFARLLEKSEQALDNIRGAAQNVQQLAGDPQMKQQLQQTLQTLPKVLQETQRTIRMMQQTLAKADRNLDHLERFTEPLGRRGEQVLVNADRLFVKLGRSAEQLESLMENLVLFSERINQQQGSLGRLMKDPELYDNMVQLTRNLNRLTIELRPLLYDARVFSDRIARDPGVLGVRGALQRNSGAKPVRQVLPWRSPDQVWPDR